MDGQTLILCERLEGVDWPAFLVRRTKHADDIIPPLEQLLQDGFTERLLAVNHQLHVHFPD